jgi:hypothetical protein
MTNTSQPTGRRHFLKTTAALTGGMTGLSFLSAAGRTPQAPTTTLSGDNDANIIGPKEGYSPQIGTLVSMMNWLRPQIVATAKNMTTEQLDWLLDAKANTIGALLYHLAASDAFYHEHTFNGLEWGKFDPAILKKFDIAMELGDPARQQIKGNNIKFYLDLLEETRAKTLAEFKTRDDKWFMTVDDKWYWGPTNNYCKWFHVCEHESHHLGQIALIKSRIPGIKAQGNGG